MDWADEPFLSVILVRVRVLAIMLEGKGRFADMDYGSLRMSGIVWLDDPFGAALAREIESYLLSMLMLMMLVLATISRSRARHSYRMISST